MFISELGGKAWVVTTRSFLSTGVTITGQHTHHHNKASTLHNRHCTMTDETDAAAVEGSPAPAASAPNPMSPGLWRQLQRTGNAPEKSGMRRALREFVRTDLFSKAKFLVSNDLTADGKVSNMIRKKCFDSRYDKNEWAVEWESWARKLTLKTINDRRNTLAQAIMNSVTKGKRMIRV